MRRSGNRSGIFVIIGVLLALFGAALIIIGIYMNNNIYANLEYFYSTGKWDSTGGSLISFGIAAAALAVVMFFVAIYFSVKYGRGLSKKHHKDDYNEVDDVIAQMAGNRTIFDVFHSEDRTRTFSFYRNKTCILKVGDTVYRGKMEPLTWEAGHPTLWRITFDIEGSELSYEVSKVEGNILVKNDNGEKIFYRN